MKYVLALVCAAALAPLFASPASATTAAQVCKLLTAAEVNNALGTTPLPPIPKQTHDGATCRWYSSDKAKNVFIQTIDAAMVGQLAQMGGKKIGGIGDAAVWSSGSVFAEKNGRGLQVGLYLSAASMTHVDRALAPLAKLAVGRY